MIATCLCAMEEEGSNDKLRRIFAASVNQCNRKCGFDKGQAVVQRSKFVD